MKDMKGQAPPPCPQCGTPVRINWVEVTALRDTSRLWLAGRIICPSDERHNIDSAYAELEWPEGLTDDDQAWLRKQVALTRREVS